MSYSDKSSRLNTKLVTAGDQHYDQVLAVTRELVNKNFENMAEIYPDTKRMDIEDEDLGKLHAELYPTQILISQPTVEISKLGYQIRFKSGTLTNPRETLNCDLTGWILTVLTDLGTQNVDKNTPPEEQKFIKDNFNIPGDYTVERLYAKITSANWNKFSMEDSYFGVDPATGKPLTWEQWKAANKGMGPKLTAFLSTWSEQMEEKGLTTLGVKVKLPPTTELDPRRPTYPPTFMTHQVHQYRNDNTPVDVAANYNCLLYCEMIQNHSPPDLLQIGNWGNFCYPAAGQSPAIEGTFALSQELFVGTFLAPHLKPLNQLSELYVYPPEFTAQSGGLVKTEWDFTPSYNPMHKSPEDDYFMPLPDLQRKAYTWTKTNELTKSYTSPERVYAKFDTKGISDVVVGWQPDKNTLVLNSKTTYSYDSVSSYNQDLSEPYAWLRDTFEATWNFTIEISTDGKGALDLFVKEENPSVVANLKVVSTRHDVQNTDTPPHQIENFRDTIKEKMTDTLVIVKENLAKLFKTSGDFVYPGNGQLTFKDPKFNNHGDLLAEVNYLPLVAGDKITVPKPDSAPLLTPYRDATKRQFGSYQKTSPDEQIR